MKSTIFLILFHVCLIVQSQEYYNKGYVITLSNDTVYGKVQIQQYKERFKTCTFKSNLGSEVYSSKDINGYGSKGKFGYTSSIVGNEFTRILCLGAINLYEHGEQVYIQKDGVISTVDQTYEINENGVRHKSDEWRLKLNDYLSDCPGDRRIQLNIPSLTRRINDFNQCMNKQNAMFEEEKSVKSQFEKTFQSGYIIENANDTLFGEILNEPRKKRYERCVFRNQKSVTIYYPQDIVGYGMGHSFYVSKVIKKAFAKTHIFGSLGLYDYRGKLYIKKNEYPAYILKADSVIADDKRKENVIGKSYYSTYWKRLLHQLTSDCLNDQELTRKLSISVGSLSRYIKRYNECLGEESIEFWKLKKMKN